MSWTYYTRLLTSSDELMPRSWAYELYEAINERLAFADTSLGVFGEIPQSQWFKTLYDNRGRFAPSGELGAYTAIVSDIAARLGVSTSSISNLTSLNSGDLPLRLYYNACRVCCDLYDRARFTSSNVSQERRFGNASGLGGWVGGTGSQVGGATWADVVADALTRFETDGGAEGNPSTASISNHLEYYTEGYDNWASGVNSDYVARWAKILLDRRRIDFWFPSIAVGTALTLEGEMQAASSLSAPSWPDESPLHYDNERQDWAHDNSRIYVSGSDETDITALSAFVGFTGETKTEVTGITTTSADGAFSVSYTPLAEASVEFEILLEEDLADYPEPSASTSRHEIERTTRGLKLAEGLAADISACLTHTTAVTG